MNRIILILCCLVFDNIQVVKATHSMGADLTYSCLGNNDYKLRVSFYRDCAGIDANTSISVYVSSASCGQGFYITLDTIAGTGQEITPICPSEQTTCNGGLFTGIQEYIYEGVVNLPANCVDWTFTYELCCRNGAITNINSPLGEEIYIYSTLNNTVSPCNNSPTFTNKPVPFVCLGQTFCFNHGAYDVDGDSLVYSLIDPLSYSGLPIVYNGTFSAQQPLSSSPAMTFDPQTGDFCMTPTALEVTVMAVLVTEYRNGVVIGQVERDIQITVINCNNILPSLTGINGTPVFTATICADEQFCFDIFSADPDLPQTLTVNWDNAIAGGNFTVTPGARPNSQFCWTPTQADVSTVAHCFTAQVIDDACPYFGSQTYSYCITVVNVEVDAGPDQNIACNSTTQISAIGPPGQTYQWSNGVSGQNQMVGPGVYIVTASNGYCSKTDTVTVNSSAGPTAAFSSSSVCSGLTTFIDNSAGPIMNWTWDFGDGNTSVLQNPQHTYSTSGNFNVCLTVTDAGGCINSYCQQVNVGSGLNSSFTFTDVCLGSSVQFSNLSSSSAINFNWDFGNGTGSTLMNPSVTYTVAGTYSVMLVVDDGAGCRDFSFQAVIVNALPQINISDISFCQGASGILNAGNSGSSFLWNTGATTQSISVSQAGVYSLTVTDQNGCMASGTASAILINSPALTVSSDTTVCVGSPLTITAIGFGSILWSTGDTVPFLNISPVIDTNYFVSLTNANGCISTDTVQINVSSTFQLNIPDVNFCQGQGATLDAGIANADYLWSTGDTTQTIYVTTPGTFNVSVILSGGCSANASANVNLISSTLVSVPVTLNLCDGANAVLDAGNSGNNYQWSTGETTQIIYPLYAGNYSVIVSDLNGCTVSFTSTLNYFPLPQASFLFSEVCLGTPVNFNSSSTITSGSIISNNWNLGDGNSSSMNSFAHQYSQAGIFPVTLEVTSDQGCTADTTMNVEVHALQVYLIL
jgi:PKD repeat protein